MCKRCGLFSTLGLAFLIGMTHAAQQPSEAVSKAALTIDKVSGPYTYANLSIFLLHGKDSITNRKFLTLNEALEQKKIIVHETSNVNMLAVENTSGDAEIFIQSGDIVKGGRQDRLISYDLLVPPKSGKVQLPSYCVESGRWSQRGQESAASFASNTAQAGKDLKLAANSGLTVSLGGGGLGGGGLGSRSSGGQGVVWDKVKEAQAKLEKTVNKNVMAKASPSSYQLTLEDKALLEKLSSYEKELAGIIKDKSDVIGIAFAVNGKVEGAEVFACHSLFVKQWPKILKSCAVDALADFDDKKKFNIASSDLVELFLKQATGPMKEVALTTGTQASQGQFANNAQAQGLRQSGQAPSGREDAAKPVSVCILQCDQKDSLMIETRDKDSNGAVLHRSYLRKDPPKAQETKPGK